MELQIFYWTGKIIWYAICGAACGAVIAISLVAPLVVYRKTVKSLWTWKIAAELAKYGFTEDEVRFAMRVPQMYLPMTQEKFLEYAKRIKERGDVAKKAVAP